MNGRRIGIVAAAFVVVFQMQVAEARVERGDKSESAEDCRFFQEQYDRGQEDKRTAKTAQEKADAQAVIDSALKVWNRVCKDKYGSIASLTFPGKTLLERLFPRQFARPEEVRR